MGQGLVLGGKSQDVKLFSFMCNKVYLNIALKAIIVFLWPRKLGTAKIGGSGGRSFMRMQ